MAHWALRQLHMPSSEVSRMASSTIRPKRRGSTGEHERCWPRMSPRDLPSLAPVGPVTRNWWPWPLKLLGSPVCILTYSATDFLQAIRRAPLSVEVHHTPAAVGRGLGAAGDGLPGHAPEHASKQIPAILHSGVEKDGKDGTRTYATIVSRGHSGNPFPMCRELHRGSSRGR